METAGRVTESFGEQTGRVDGPRRAAADGRGGASRGHDGEGIRRVALEEMALRRRRLGELTPAQERALESLLVSVADNISELVSGLAARTSATEPEYAARAPSTFKPEESQRPAGPVADDFCRHDAT